MAGLISQFNIAAFEFIKAIASQRLDTVAMLLSWSPFIVVPLLFLFLLRKKDDYALPFAFSFVTLYVLAILAKPVIMEPRPCSVQSLNWINDGVCAADYFAPLGPHPLARGPRPVFLESAGESSWRTDAWMILVLFSRIYLGQHYLTDILISAAASLLLVYLIRRNSARINRVARTAASKAIGIKGSAAN